MKAREANFDGIVGPTHNYAGLSFGNLASRSHAARTANPRAAVRQGLLKMRTLAQRGILQGVLPPHERPSIALLRTLGFAGSDAQVLQRAARDAPRLLAAAASASPMWAANAATVSASADCADARVHFTPANLASNLHRSIEAATTTQLLQAVFADPRHFVVHAPLPATSALFDEGAANHMRLCATHGAAGIECFVYGRVAGVGGGSAAQEGEGLTNAADRADMALPSRFPARQTREAGEAIARRHGLTPAGTAFIRQLPQAIDAGVFHNDVIAVADQQWLFCHERAFAEQRAVYDMLRRQLDAHGGSLRLIEVPDALVSIDAAVASYLFNSQLITPCADDVEDADEASLSAPSVTPSG
ncbi:MAG: N-succinylarginine dihydrolase, partial [Janthinobacterium lividum]